MVRYSQWTTGLILLAIVAVIWTFASVLVQRLCDDLGFCAPFFLTYCCTTLFSVYLPAWHCLVAVGWVKDVPPSRLNEAAGNGDEDEDDRTALTTTPSYYVPVQQRFTHRKTASIGAFICPLWFLANFSYNASLQMTSVTSNTIISTTSSLFTFFFSLCFLSERFTWGKLIGVAMCMAGTILVGLSDRDSDDDDGGGGGGGSSSPQHAVWGDVVCLFAAMMYGAYTVAIRKKIPSDDHVAMPLFFGYLGLVNAVVLWPILLILYFTHTEDLSYLNGEVMGWILVKGFFDNVLSDYLWARAVVLTSPTVATVGLSLTIPLAFVADFVGGKSNPTVESVLGALAVILGFVLVNASSTKKQSDGNGEAHSSQHPRELRGYHSASV